MMSSTNNAPPSAPPNAPPKDHRDVILERVRRALAVPTDAQVRHHTGGDRDPSLSPVQDADWLPDPGPTRADHRQNFARVSEQLKTRLKIVPTPERAAEVVAKLAQTENWTSIGSSGEAIVEPAVASLNLATVRTDQRGYDPKQLESCDAGLTGCTALIARTGSILVNGIDQGGRVISVLPPHHVVIATVDQLVPNLSDGYGRLRERFPESLPNQICFITGPSRTGDIERILVLGAHGPRAVTVILIDPSCETE